MMNDADERFDNGLVFERCPYCNVKVWGSESDIDSGLRKHIEYCDAAQEPYDNDMHGDTYEDQ